MGTRIGKYIVTQTLGAGTFGKVKLARHSESGEQYAIKIIEKQEIVAHELTQSVRREISIMRALRHRNIVALKEVLSSKQKLYIVMELVSGGELYDLVDTVGQFPEDIARKYFQQLIDGVDYCHQSGVCHRDLKPENLLLDEHGVLKISDFGVSGMMGAQSPLFTACGTPYYAAPEVVSNASAGYDGDRVDVWSCGVILYLLLTGKLPFKEENMAKLYDAIKHAQVRFPPAISKDASNLISNMLIKDPKRRYGIFQIRQHPWFLRDYDSSGDNAVPGHMIRELHGLLDNQGKPKKQWGMKLPAVFAVKRMSKDEYQPPSSKVTPPLSREPVQDASEPTKGEFASRSISRSYDDNRSAATPIPEFSRPEVKPETGSPVSSASSGASNDPTQTGCVKGPTAPSRSSLEEATRNLSAVTSVEYDGPLQTGVLPILSERAPTRQTEERKSAPVSSIRESIGPLVTRPDITTLVRSSLEGKPEYKIASVVQQLNAVDIDCLEDLETLADALGGQAQLEQWLLTNGKLPSVTSMRLARAVFSSV